MWLWDIDQATHNRSMAMTIALDHKDWIGVWGCQLPQLLNWVESIAWDRMAYKVSWEALLGGTPNIVDIDQ